MKRRASHRIPPVPEDVGSIRFSFAKAAWLYGMAAPSVVWGWSSLSVPAVLTGLALALLTLCLGHSVGLHRGIIHRTYRTSRAARNVLAYLFVLSGLGGPISWIRLHHVRDYWQNTASCPPYFGYAHGLLRDYVWNLHYRFVARDASRYGVDPELLEDRWLAWLEKTWPLHTLALAAFLWAAAGLEFVIVAVCMRVSASILGHWYVGFMAHKHGRVRYALEGSDEAGRNLLLLGILSFGEGFHNNHHAHPGSARMGEAWYELDLGWAAVRILERLGLAWDVRSLSRGGTLRPNARAITEAASRPGRPARGSSPAARATVQGLPT